MTKTAVAVSNICLKVKEKLIEYSLQKSYEFFPEN